MKNLLLSCDQVFDVLTRGPFPTGEPGDEAVEHHLRACHDCRRLAEALRPAVELLHEAITADQALGLPEYQGDLSSTRTARKIPNQSRTLASGGRALAVPAGAAPRDAASIERAVSGLRLVAALVLVAALGALLYGMALSPGLHRRPAAKLAHLTTGSNALPDQQGLLTLASFELPPDCLADCHRPRSLAAAEAILQQLSAGTLDRLACCTECHRAGHPVPAASYFTVAAKACSLCHRG